MLKRLVLVLFAGLLVHAEALSKPSCPQPERRGCCSWHKGVCGCEGGQVQCCDGTTSPTCTC
jgi:hypothetical protein